MKPHRDIDFGTGGDASPFEQNITVTTFVKLDLWDSLKVLFGRAIKVYTFITIPQEQLIERYNTGSSVKIVPTSTHFVKQDKPQFGYSPKFEEDHEQKG